MVSENCRGGEELVYIYICVVGRLAKSFLSEIVEPDEIADVQSRHE